MTENIAAYEANSAKTYDARRLGTGFRELDPLPGTDFRMAQTIRCLEWAWANQPDAPRAILDVAAGAGNVGWWARLHEVPHFHYHAVEQSTQQLSMIRGRVEDSSVCEWRCDPGGTPLIDALECAEDTFLRHYPVVLLSHGPEHHADHFHIMNECWSLVRPGGFLLVVSARNDPHISHFRKYDLDDLAALCGHFAGLLNPIVTWPLDYWADIFIAVPKPVDEVTA